MAQFADEALPYPVARTIRADVAEALTLLDGVWRQEGHSADVNAAIVVLVSLDTYVCQHLLD